MLIIENPIFLLIIVLCILILFLLLFKILNFLDGKKSKASKGEKKSEEKSPQVIESEKIEDINVDPKNMTNYLYDRFVTTPTDIDGLSSDDKISDAFLNDNDYLEIRNHKVDIKVEPVESDTKNSLYKKIEELTNNNRSEKERLLEEFNGLSREMKLLLIENILQKIE